MNEDRVATSPEESVPSAEVRDELNKIKASAPFIHAERMRKFLQFVVDQTLQGKGEQLNEFLVGIEVFEQGEKFDPRIDSVVRTEAIRLRSKLREYYDSEGLNSTVRCDVPKGSYKPVFTRVSKLEYPQAAWTLTPVPRTVRANRRRLGLYAVAGVLLAAAAIGARFYFYHHSKLTEKDTVVLADFSNETGDSVFDATLRQGLAVQLEQSPFLNILSDHRIQQTLRFMGSPADTHINAELARQICQRTESAAVLSGSISSLGRQYVIGLTGMNCRTGDTLAREQVTAEDKEHVLGAMGKAASRIRAKLGESLTSIQKFDTPIEEATTPSLEALQAYTLGRLAATKNVDSASAIISYQHAIALDPNFAMAYASLGSTYYILGELNLASENLKKAYDLRDRVSEREKSYISSHFHQYVAGDLEKANQICELWAQTYPKDAVPVGTMASIHAALGQHEKALAEYLTVLRLDPANGLSYANVVQAYIWLNRLDDARAVAQQAVLRQLDSPDLRFDMYVLAFLENDATAMQQQVNWAVGKPGAEDVMMAVEADTAAFFGQLAKARGLTYHAIASAEAAGQKETAASYQADAALREALAGNTAEARRGAELTLTLSSGRDVQAVAALAFAFSGDFARADRLANELAKRFPNDSIVKSNYLPTIRAVVELKRGNLPEGAKAVQIAAPYELGAPSQTVLSLSLYPAYVRGLVYLAEHQGNAAAGEFQKIIDHRGVVGNEIIGALAHLGLARARGVAGNKVGARIACRDFATLWKDSNPDVPVLEQAKAECAKFR